VRQQAGIPAEVSGVFVASVAPGTPAAEAGLQAGDVIAEVAGEAVDDADALREAIAGAEDGPLLLRIWRAGGYSFVPVTLSAGEASEG
jgi:S1-C subfamily serine protease